MPARFKQNTGELGQKRFKYRLLTQLARAINLTKNSQFYVRQGDVERLIQQGYLQKLS